MTADKVGHQFDISETKVLQYVNDVCSTLIAELRDKVIYLPYGEDLTRCLELSANHAPPMPGAALYMDGSYVGYKAPQHSYLQYKNHYGYTSLQYQVVCDRNNLIRDFTTGWAGSVHDARVFHNSTLFTRLLWIHQGINHSFTLPNLTCITCQVPII